MNFEGLVQALHFVVDKEGRGTGCQHGGGRYGLPDSEY